MPRRRAGAGSKRAAAAQISSLADRLAGSSISGGGRRRKATPRRVRRRGGRSLQLTGNVIPGAEGGFPNVVRSSGRVRRRRNGPTVGVQIGNGGQITLTRSELFTTCTVPANSGFLGLALPVAPSGSVMTFLWKLSSAYTRLKWNLLEFEWRPAVGTTQNGIVTYAVRLMDDRKAGAPPAPTDRVGIQALYPVNDHPVWQSACMVVNKDLLMSRKWYATLPGSNPDATFDNFDYAPGTLEVGVQATGPPTAADPTKTAALFAGELWVTYSVTLDGTRSEN